MMECNYTSCSICFIYYTDQTIESSTPHYSQVGIWLSLTSEKIRYNIKFLDLKRW